jgi:hypothetical protein
LVGAWPKRIFSFLPGFWVPELATCVFFAELLAARAALEDPFAASPVGEDEDDPGAAGGFETPTWSSAGVPAPT